MTKGRKDKQWSKKQTDWATWTRLYNLCMTNCDCETKNSNQSDVPLLSFVSKCNVG